MIVMVCVDDKGGMLFNHRRQSKDRVLRQEMLRMIGDAPLRVTPYTAKQFTEEETPRLLVAPDAITAAGPVTGVLQRISPWPRWQMQSSRW